MRPLSANITRLYAFSFLQMTLFPMAVITLFWKDQIGFSLTQILLLQSILSIVMVVMEYPPGGGVASGAPAHPLPGGVGAGAHLASQSPGGSRPHGPLRLS